MKPDVLENGSGSVRTVAWSFDAKLLASGGSDMRIILWDAKKGERLTELKGHRCLHVAKRFLFSPLFFFGLRPLPP